jgi:magnesium-transporting ATPase (P-type)
LTSVAFLGTSVESGSATAVIVATGQDTYLGGMAASLAVPAPPTAFDRGISRFTWLMLRFMAVMVPLVFVINGLTKGTWGQAFFFAIAVAVGLTPEMLPMIVTVCLSKGAGAMTRKKVIVKRLNAIQNLGAMDVLCTDKTGTLTQDRVVLERHCVVALREDDGVLALAYVNSHFQTGLKNVLDRAILAHEETHAHARVPETRKVDEIPFDFQRGIMSVVVRTPEGKDRIVSKGAPEALLTSDRYWPTDAASVQLPNPGITATAHGPDGFDVQKFPTIEFVLREVRKVRKSGGTYAATVSGDFTCRGITKRLSVEATLTHLPGKAAERHRSGSDLLVLRSTFKIHRRDFGIKPRKGDEALAEDIEVRLGLAGAAP